MESLPSDILLDILSRVPTQSVLECKLVCKRLGTLIHQSGTQLTNMHLSRQLNHLYGGDSNNDNIPAKVETSLYFSGYYGDNSDCTSLLFYGGPLDDLVSLDEKYSYKEKLKRINHPPLPIGHLWQRFVGSCNGLMCMFIYPFEIRDSIYIFNPITREYAYLPELVGEVDLGGFVLSGFGYINSTNEYKVVRIYFPGSLREGHVIVYTLGSGCGWRQRGTISAHFYTSDAGRYANGAIYWITRNDVVAFDLVDEGLRLLPLPPIMIDDPHVTGVHGLVVLGGDLCLYVHTHRSRMEIWSFKKRGSCTEETWCMNFDINYEGVEGSNYLWFEPIVLTNNQEMILIRSDSAPYCYDLKTTTLKEISNNEEEFNSITAIPHVNTFASLQAMGEKSKRYRIGDN